MRNEYDFSKGRRGAVLPIPPGKTRITIRLDDDVVAWFRASVHKSGGGNYQTLINAELREAMMRAKHPLETVLRRVVREELNDGLKALGRRTPPKRKRPTASAL